MLFLSHLIPLSYAVSFHLLFIWSCLILINLVSSSLFSSFACHLCPVSSYLVLSHLSPSYLWLVVLSHLILLYIISHVFCFCLPSSLWPVVVTSHLLLISLNLVFILFCLISSFCLVLCCFISSHLVSSYLLISPHLVSPLFSSPLLCSCWLVLSLFSSVLYLSVIFFLVSSHSSPLFSSGCTDYQVNLFSVELED